MRITPFLFLLLTLLSGCQTEPPVLVENHEAFRINQLGYYPVSPKKAVVVANEALTDFNLYDRTKGEVVFTGKLSDQQTWGLAGEQVYIADFSAFEQPGEFELQVNGVGASYPFEIKEDLYKEAFGATLKALYLQRASTDIPETFGGTYARALGHPDGNVNFHPSSGRTGTTASSRGWYDAGDYGKYVVNGAFALGQLLLFMEEYPEAVRDNHSNIPESGNDISDYLDEMRYEMDWLLTMQDEDGGLFHKLTTKSFEGMIMPNLAIQPRFIIGKGTAATLDFAAVAARAFRVFYDTDRPYAYQCIEAAEKAWDWATKNPNVAYKNPEDIVTGEYGDNDFTHERYWAAAELLTTVGGQPYAEVVENAVIDFEFKAGNSWTQYMRYLGLYTLLDHEKRKQETDEELERTIKASADAILATIEKNDYRQPITDFHWGSNSDVANAAIVLAQAYRQQGEQKYLDGILEMVDYIFGKNATGHSFVTGFGDKTPMYIHHRPSVADGIEEPIPGWLSGGPNSRQQDQNEKGVNYPDNAPPMKSWVDQVPSYASNEICLNWNAPLTYILGFLEQEMKRK